MPWRFLLPFLVLVVAFSADAKRRPNIVLLIGDDHGWPYSGFMGDDVVETPTLDRLAAEGTVFTHVQMPSSRCRPSMQTVLSGLHPEDWIAKGGPLGLCLAMVLTEVAGTPTPTSRHDAPSPPVHSPTHSETPDRPSELRSRSKR